MKTIQKYLKILTIFLKILYSIRIFVKSYKYKNNLTNRKQIILFVLKIFKFSSN